MSISDLITTSRLEADKRVYFNRFEVLGETINLLKARLYISPNLFVQIYRNELFNTTNFVLILIRNVFLLEISSMEKGTDIYQVRRISMTRVKKVQRQFRCGNFLMRLK